MAARPVPLRQRHRRQAFEARGSSRPIASSKPLATRHSRCTGIFNASIAPCHSASPRSGRHRSMAGRYRWMATTVRRSSAAQVPARCRAGRSARTAVRDRAHRAAPPRPSLLFWRVNELRCAGVDPGYPDNQTVFLGKGKMVHVARFGEETPCRQCLQLFRIKLVAVSHVPSA